MCTIFAGVENTTTVLAKNYDCFVDGGMIFTNRRNMSKKSLVMPPEKEFSWISKYGSVTFSQSGKGMPSCGINEKGLIVEQATLPATKYQEKDERAEVNCLEAIQYLLDVCETVSQAVEKFQNFRISNNSVKIHYFLMDKGGNKGVIEFLNGAINYILGKDILPIITNSIYRDNCTYKGTYSSEYEENSFIRFEIVKSELLKRGIMTVDRAFTILEKAKRTDTIWSIVYDLKLHKIYFKYGKQRKKMIDLNVIDYGQTAESYLFDMESEEEFCWQPYCREMNRKNIERFYRNQKILKLLELPDAKFVINSIDNHVNQLEE
ncbi:carcinine hydrolase/isopenicillin-N N-acyltransferase family protein [Anaerosacchariphilus polymeriproducens]|uniref:Linear amide C-N hydrolase n=1 Tax=Anaerosacchariphilus polymeriproducens TaxID=1812858 RepID=A0A371AYG3_9FIRM|nr:carcinine hydrolase/isopenicillin-N N-acyltransferase family protein [Anaerosacchariphilus polymeriproducens]RDU24606.1 linear amide C-N hydrolase [Anaerosacchariphilus polymeriproducens]